MRSRDSVSPMENSAWHLRVMWGALFATLLAWLAMPYVLPPRAQPWYEAQIAVAGFVLAILSAVAGVASFALRESLVRDVERQPAANGGSVWIRTRLFALWFLCALVGVFGGILGHYAAVPAAAWPYLVGAAALFVIHAPRAAFLSRLRAPA